MIYQIVLLLVQVASSFKTRNKNSFVLDLQDTGEQTHRLRLLISGLPSINKRVLEYLLIFFSK